MQVGVDDIYMHTNFDGCGFSGFWKFCILTMLL